jgi:hypothetical protein
MYPPTQSVTPTPALAAPLDEHRSSVEGRGSSNARPLPQNTTNRETASSINPKVELKVLLFSVSIVTLLLAGGLVLAIREFKRLSSHAVSYDIAARKLDVNADMARPLGGNESRSTLSWCIGPRNKTER